MNNSDFKYVFASEDFRRCSAIRVDNLPSSVDGPFFTSFVRYRVDLKEHIDQYKPLRDFHSIGFVKRIPIDLDAPPEDFELLLLALTHAMEAWKVEYGVEFEFYRFSFSGAKGLHVGIPGKLINLAPMKNPEVYLRRFVEILVKGLEIEKYVDFKIYSDHRYFRYSNSQHASTGLYKTPLKPSEVIGLPRGDIFELAKRPRTADWWIMDRELAVNPILHNIFLGILSGSKPSTSTDINRILTVGEYDGNRHNRAFEIARILRDSGYSDEECLEALQRWDKMNHPPISLSEFGWFKSMVKSAFTGAKLTKSSGTEISILLRQINNIIPVNNAEYRALIHALSITNTEEKKWNGITIEPGSFICSMQSLADQAGVKKSQSRTLLKKLALNNFIEITTLPRKMGQMITWRGLFAEIFDQKKP